MADFALWINACEESLGMRPGEALTTRKSSEPKEPLLGFLFRSSRRLLLLPVAGGFELLQSCFRFF
jgi:hypothetical protein